MSTALYISLWTLKRRRWLCLGDPVGNTGFMTLGDFTKHDSNLGCVCSKCERKGVVHRLVLARWCYLKRKNMAVECLPEYLRCSACGSRPNRIAPEPLPPSFPGYGRDERQWKRFERKLRG
jgi:hypothetical protein